MSTNEERREVASRLRDIDTSNCYTSLDVLRAIEDACGCNVGKDWQDMVELKDQLADLIEPDPKRTCGLRSRLTGSYCYECSECGKGMKPEWAYCPSCGAKIVD